MPTIPTDLSMPTPRLPRRAVAVPFAATFPTFAVHYNSPSHYDSDLRIDRAVDGTGRARAFYTQAKRTIDVKLPAMSQEEVDVLLAFVNANLAEPFGFYIDCPPQAISVVFVGAPTITPLGAGLFDASLRVTQFP